MPRIADLFDLSGRVAVVAGGGGALGGAVSVGLAEAGAAVAVVGLHRASAQRVVDVILASGGDAIAIAADLTCEAAVASAFDTVDQAFGRVDVLVNAVSARVERFAAEDFPLDQWRQMLDANLTSYLLCSQAAARMMIESRRGGSIVNFGSIAGVSALGRGNVAYSAAKGGVVQLTRETAYAWAPYGIRVNSVLPCQFNNGWWTERLADPSCRPLVDRVVSGIPLGRLGRVDEIVGPVLFLASDAASMVTGALLPVDGGNGAMNPGASLDW